MAVHNPIAEPSRIESAPRAARGNRARAEELQALKARDNVTNFYYLGQVWVIVVVSLVAAIWCDQEVRAAGLGWWWNIPVWTVAILAIGASQHQFGGGVHEGTHYILFADRKLNELASDWLAGFPIYTSTYAFRLHHLAHHQFVNDPVRDPNFAQAQQGQHWLDFPLTHIELLWGTLKLMWPHRLFRYMMARAKFSALGGKENPYAKDDQPSFNLPTHAGVVYAVLMPVALIAATAYGDWQLVLAAGSLLWGGIMAYYLAIPDEAFPQTHLEPVISHRWTAIGRVTFMALVYGGVSAAELATGAPAWTYFGLLWILPLFTAFPFFMILREWLQHGNADRGRYTNSRVFLMNPFVRYAMFPFGMDYHLPHHMMASVPHFRLPQLHELMMRTDAEYAAKGMVVEGYFRPTNKDMGYPSAMDVLTPEFSPASKEAIFVDDAAIADVEVKDRAAIDRQSELSRRGQA